MTMYLFTDLKNVDHSLEHLQEDTEQSIICTPEIDIVPLQPTRTCIYAAGQNLHTLKGGLLQFICTFTFIAGLLKGTVPLAMRNVEFRLFLFCSI